METWSSISRCSPNPVFVSNPKTRMKEEKEEKEEKKTKIFLRAEIQRVDLAKELS